MTQRHTMRAQSNPLKLSLLHSTQSAQHTRMHRKKNRNFPKVHIPFSICTLIGKTYRPNTLRLTSSRAHTHIHLSNILNTRPFSKRSPGARKIVGKHPAQPHAPPAPPMQHDCNISITCPGARKRAREARALLTLSTSLLN